ncbi:MAG: hypothetical protein IJ188_03120 [Clostridia bacterium]|nr:hypothetical protein [Clostridia bacterium]
MPEEGGRRTIPFPQHSNVVMHSECRAELISLIHEGEIPEFIAAYEQRIGFLSRNLGKETIYHPKWFEVLKKAQGLRSVHFVTFRNLRILYVVENSKAFLLLAFEERQGHKNTEYSKFIDPALKRLGDKERML